MQLIVSESVFKSSFETKHGGQLHSYRVSGTLDGKPDVVDMSFKDHLNAPKPDDILDVTIEETQWGKKAKKVNVGGFSPLAKPRQDDPEKQAMIVRQNALGNAVQFFIAKATLEKKPELLETDNILLVATKFAAFSLGELKPTVKKLEVPDKSTKDITSEEIESLFEG